jgi:hypothetical protein
MKGKLIIEVKNDAINIKGKLDAHSRVDRLVLVRCFAHAMGIDAEDMRFLATTLYDDKKEKEELKDESGCVGDQNV